MFPMNELSKLLAMIKDIPHKVEGILFLSNQIIDSSHPIREWPLNESSNVSKDDLILFSMK